MALENETTWTLDELISQCERHAEPVVRYRLTTPGDASDVAKGLVDDAMKVIGPALIDPNILRAADPASLRHTLAAYLSNAQSDPPGKLVLFHTREAAHTMMTTWVDILDQGIDENEGKLALEPLKMIPSWTEHRGLVEDLEKSLEPTVLTSDDAAGIMEKLRQPFPNNGVAQLPLGVRLHFENEYATHATR